jgi:hypothetical protein
MDTLWTESMILASLLPTSELLEEPRGNSAKTVSGWCYQDSTMTLISCTRSTPEKGQAPDNALRKGAPSRRAGVAGMRALAPA